MIRLAAGTVALVSRILLLPFHIVVSSLLQSADSLLREVVLDWRRFISVPEGDEDAPDGPA